MKAHRNLTRQDVLKHGPSKLCLMIASEFYRAVSRQDTRENVMACYGRARELMGILETQELPIPVARHLKPLYQRANYTRLLAEDDLNPARVSRIGAEMAAAFEKAAQHV